MTFRNASDTASLHAITNRDLAPREVFPVHHSPSGPPSHSRLRDALYRIRRPRLSLRGTIAPVVLVCGVLAGIALVLPSYAPAVTGTNGPLGLDVSGSSAGSSAGSS